MPFYESAFFLNRVPVGKATRLPAGSESAIELPCYRNGNQRQLHFPDNDHAVLLEINVAKRVYEQHGYMSGENFQRMGMIARRRGKLFSRKIFWKPE